jgi:fatty acid desaturase
MIRRRARALISSCFLRRCGALSGRGILATDPVDRSIRTAVERALRPRSFSYFHTVKLEFFGNTAAPSMNTSIYESRIRGEKSNDTVKQGTPEAKRCFSVGCSGRTGGVADACPHASTACGTMGASDQARSDAQACDKVLTDVSVLGGTGHQAMITNREFPSVKALLAAIPDECYERSFVRSSAYAAMSVLLTLACGWFGYTYLWNLQVGVVSRMAGWASLAKVGMLVLWALYAAVTGTIATGVWVIAHECGHGAFCSAAWLQDLIGFVLHSSLLVPYFSWQRSHAVHHARTNHLDEGETHVPHTANSVSGKTNLRIMHWIGDDAFGALNVFMHLVLGWPAYLLYGATGGPVRGLTNHFIPFSFGQGELQSVNETLPRPVSLYPGWRWKLRVLASDLGVLATLGLLYSWAQYDGPVRVCVVYGLPYLVTNMWLVLYTWLQHTDVDIPHYDSQHWSWNKGALLTVDRPYPKLIDFLHHHIGTTHVVHHVCSRIPHYHGKKATEALKKAFPEHYLYDPTPILQAIWRIGCNCVAVRQVGDLWVYTVSCGEEEMNERAVDNAVRKAQKTA